MNRKQIHIISSCVFCLLLTFTITHIALAQQDTEPDSLVLLTDTYDAIPGDTLLVPPDSLYRAVQDSVILLEGTRITAASAYIRPESQKPLPHDVSPGIIEESNLGGEYYFAIVRHNLKEFENTADNNLISVADGKIKSAAFVISKSLLDAKIDYREKNVFNSIEEAGMYRDTLLQRFDKEVQVVIFLRTYDIQLTQLENNALYDVFVDINGNKIEPKHIKSFGVSSRIVNNESWFERRVVITFPRRSGGTDLWNATEIYLNLKPKLEGLNIGADEHYIFQLVP